MNNKRFIEASFPVKEVSIESAREKNIRHGHISTLHIWWARRPLASSRATAYAALIPAPENDVEWDKRRQFIIDLSKWENSLNPTIIEKARKDILGIRDQESGISEELFPNSQSQMPNPLLNGQWMVTDSQTPMPDAQSLLANFDPAKGTVKGAVARCLVCGSTVDANTTRKLFQEGKASQRMIATVLHHPKKKGKTYRVATGKDLEVFREAEKYLEEKRTKLKEEWGIDPVPDEGLVRTGGNQIAVLHYGMYKFGDLFNTRQKLALIIFVEKVREAYKKMIENGCDEEYAKAVVTYLGLGIDRLSTHLCSLVRWRSDAISFERVFDRQALSMIWDYGEVNPFSDSRGHWDLEPMLETIKHVSSNSTPATITQSSATSLPYPDNFFDAIFTDPPYYDNVYYSNLSDFFYVWLKRTVGDLYPDLFSTPLTPKSKEIVADSIRHAEKSDAKAFFKENLKKSFQEIHRVLKPNGITTIVYTHRSTSGWETLINSLLDSGLVITASWPIHTEMRGKLNAQGTASLMSSIYFVARKMERNETGWLNEVKEEIKRYIYEKLERLWQEGISGADYYIAAIGSAIEIFGKYEKVMNYEGNVIRADKLLDFVRDVVTDYAVRQILHNGIAGELSPLTKFYILWRWTYKEVRVTFDDARKLAQSTGIDLTKEWNRGFIKKEKEFISVLGPQDREDIASRQKATGNRQ